MNDVLLQLAGRLHPVVLHLPIGVLVGAIVVELWARLRGRAPERSVRLVLIWLLALSGAAAVASGLLLSEEPGYVPDALFLHKWLGIVTGTVLLLAAVFATFRYESGYLGVLLTAGVLIVPTGHLGASVTHGDDFLTAPFAEPAAATAAPGAPAAGETTWYAAEIAPILEMHCTTCHGANRRKAGLAVHTPAAIVAGTERGSVLTNDGALPHTLIRRVRLPLRHDEHMPPDGKRQPTPAQVEALTRWIEAGAPFDAPPPADAASADAALVDAAPSPPAARELPPGALADLRAANVHAEIIDPDSGGVWIDFTAVPDMAVDRIVRLLAPVAASTTELSLPGIAGADRVLTACAPWARLERLDLSGAAVDRAGLVAAAAAGRLEELTLVGTTLTADAADELTHLETIRVLHVWGADVLAPTLAALRGRPTLTLNEGAVDGAQPVEVEPEFRFGKPPPTALSLAPVNTTCPVTGGPVDTRFAIVHEGRVIGFCCNACPGKFWDDPDAFTVPADAPPEE